MKSTPGFTGHYSLSMRSQLNGAAMSKDNLEEGITMQATRDCHYPHTRTACPVPPLMWCRDYCGEEPQGGWYPCGVCIKG
jgi:hypothetical protein